MRHFNGMPISIKQPLPTLQNSVFESDFELAPPLFEKNDFVRFCFCIIPTENINALWGICEILTQVVTDSVVSVAIETVKRFFLHFVC